MTRFHGFLELRIRHEDVGRPRGFSEGFRSSGPKDNEKVPGTKFILEPIGTLLRFSRTESHCLQILLEYWKRGFFPHNSVITLQAERENC